MAFKDIQGQDKAIHLLKKYLQNQQLASAYLFIGPDGVGKRLVAQTLAKILNCSADALDSCDQCVSCRKIDKNQHPDFHYLGNPDFLTSQESEAIKIDGIRQLQKEINLKPYEGRKKVFLIDNAHQLTAEAANALLKVLEEPPQNSLIILITSQPAKLFKTIISRCQIIKFSCLSRPKLEGILRKDYHLDLAQAHFFAYFCEGRLGYALRLKDTPLYQEKNSVIDNFILGQRSQSNYSSPVDKTSLRRDLNLVAVWLRDIYLVKSGIPHAELVNFDRRDQLLKVMHQYSFSELDETFTYIRGALLYLEQNINAKLIFAYLKGLLKG